MVSTDRHTDRQTDRRTDRQTDGRHAKIDDFEISMPQKVYFHQNLEIDFSDQCKYFLYTPYSRESKNLFCKTAQYFLDVLNKPLYLQNGARYRKMLQNMKVARLDL